MLVILCCKLYFLQFIIRSFSYEWSCIMCMVIHVKKQDVILTFLSVFAENELFFRKSPFWKYGARWNFGHWSIEGSKDKSIDHNVELQLPFLPFCCWCCQFLNGKAGLPLLKEGIYGLNLNHRNGHSCAWDVETLHQSCHLGSLRSHWSHWSCLIQFIRWFLYFALTCRWKSCGVCVKE